MVEWSFVFLSRSRTYQVRECAVTGVLSRLVGNLVVVLQLHVDKVTARPQVLIIRFGQKFIVNVLWRLLLVLMHLLCRLRTLLKALQFTQMVRVALRRAHIVLD